MEKFFFILFVSIAFFACSNDDSSDLNQSNIGKLTFKIGVVNKLTMNTKAGQPINSQEPTQNVGEVKIYAFKDNSGTFNWVKTFDVTTWTLGDASKTFTVPDADKLSAGDYRFIAVGRNTSGNYTITTLTTTTTDQQLLATITNSGDEYEIFAGNSNTITIGAAQEAHVSLEMTRKVAGFLGYFGNIPAEINGTTVKYLRMTINKTNKSVALLNGTGSNPVNATFDLINIDLTSQTVGTNGLYEGNSISGVTKLDYSQLAGGYLIPITGGELTVGLYAADNTVLRTWKVVDETSATQFEIKANSLYSLGQKMKANSTDGGAPSDPNKKDRIMDLQKDQDIVITISTDWEMVNLSMQE